MEESISASPVRRVAVRTQQQRNMKMVFTVSHAKQNLDRGIQTIHAAGREIIRGVKRQAVRSRSETRAFRQQFAASAVFIRPSRSLSSPIARRILSLQAHRHACCRFSRNGIKHVRRDSAHPAIHLFRRICMIWRCSSAVCCSSVASSLCNRRRRISRISLADFPVAQTIKIRPNFCSYSRLPHFSASFMASSADAACRCYCSDQTEDCGAAVFFACDSPICVWLRKASSHLESLSSCQTASEV